MAAACGSAGSAAINWIGEEMARLKEQSGFDQDILKDVLARLTLSQREALYRLATVAPVDWESSSSPE